MGLRMSDEDLARLSIRSRMALALQSVESVVVLHGWSSPPPLCRVLDLLWDFCSAEWFNEWERSVDEGCGELIAHAWYLDGMSVPEDRMAEDAPLRVLSDDLILVLNRCVEIGKCHLYSAIDGVGESSIRHLQWVLAWAREKGVETLDFRPFLTFSFDEELGWGSPFDPSPFRQLAGAGRM
jgi:hypothetical protein